MGKMKACLWFDHEAEEAAKFYVSVFRNSKILETSYYSEGAPRPAGSVLVVNFSLDGNEFMAINGGPEFKFSEAISIYVDCDTQDEVDRLWKALTENGGQESQCGWLKDKFGLSWQIVPKKLGALMQDPDPQTARRVTMALMQMKKIDLAALRAAKEQA